MVENILFDRYVNICDKYSCGYFIVWLKDMLIFVIDKVVVFDNVVCIFMV